MPDVKFMWSSCRSLDCDDWGQLDLALSRYERITGPPGPALFDSAFGLVAHLYLIASVTQAGLRAANIKQNVAICTWMSHSQYFRVVPVMTNRCDHMGSHTWGLTEAPLEAAYSFNRQEVIDSND